MRKFAIYAGKRKTLNAFGAVLCVLTLMLCGARSFQTSMNQAEALEGNDETNLESIPLVQATNPSEVVYLSDLSADKMLRTKVGWRELYKNSDSDGNRISVKIEDSYYGFPKGLFAHAASELIFDLGEYAEEYGYFTAYVGLNQTSSQGDGVAFHFYTANGDVEWTAANEKKVAWTEFIDYDYTRGANAASSGLLKSPGSFATKITIPLNGVRYLRLIANQRGNNTADHAVYADAKLVKEISEEGDTNYVIESQSELEQKITERYQEVGTVDDDDLHYLLMKWELVNRVGRFALSSFAAENDNNQKMVEWLLQPKVLDYYIMGGRPDKSGSYAVSLVELANLYAAYSEDFKDETPAKYDKSITMGDIYTRMALALSLTHSKKVGLWYGAVGTNASTSTGRYQIYKDMYNNNNLVILKQLDANGKAVVGEDGNPVPAMEKDGVTPKLDIAKWFEHYHIEEMRFIFSSATDDEELLWLNEYTQSKVDAKPGSYGSLISPHPYMDYRWENLGQAGFYDPAMKDQWDQYYLGIFSKYNVTYGEAGVRKVWMLLRNPYLTTGAVCGGISKTGVAIRTSHGIPSTVVGQPGHAAMLYYWENAQGQGYWNLDNDVSGLALSEKGERLLLNWGSAGQSYANTGYQVPYMQLSQDALNQDAELDRAEKLVMLSRRYDAIGDQETRVKLLEEALDTQSINLDAWLEMIDSYADTGKTQEEYLELARRVGYALRYYPLPMHHMFGLIGKKITDPAVRFGFELNWVTKLKEAAATPNGTPGLLQPGYTRTEANYLLGKTDKNLASFSFDGENAGQIVLAERFAGGTARWDYNLNFDPENRNSETDWKTVSSTDRIKLTQEELDSISENKDIYVHIVGTSYADENLFKIDITKGTLLSELYANDLEDKLIGVNNNTEWRYRESDGWTSYRESAPDLSGNAQVQVRQRANGTQLASDVSGMYSFTDNENPDTKKYIPIAQLSISGFSSEAANHAGAASKTIDGNYWTRYHSNWDGADKDRYVIVKLDRPVHLAAVDYVPAGGGNGRIATGKIEGSRDGIEWVELARLDNPTYKGNVANVEPEAGEQNTQTFEVPEDLREQRYQYVKITALTTTNGRNFFAARAFNFYEDLTHDNRPQAWIEYSTTDKTSQNVVARLVSDTPGIQVTNNDGSDTYVFSENGTFQFEFADSYGETNVAQAEVNWINRDIPSAEVDYTLNNDNRITISLDNISEDVYLLDKEGKKLNFVQVEDGRPAKIDYLDNDGNVYKTIGVKTENGVQEIAEVSYVNTVPTVEGVATYKTVFTTENNQKVTVEKYYDRYGAEVTDLSDKAKADLRELQQPISDPLEYTFTQDGDHQFKLMNIHNNVAYKTIKVDYSAEAVMVSDVTYDITYLTREDVRATLRVFMVGNDGKVDAEVVEGDPVHVFTENGTHVFQYRAPMTAKTRTAEDSEVNYNEIKQHTAEVTWIDKAAPTAEVEYETLDNGNVVARLVNESEEIVMTNNGMSREREFTENGEFNFKFQDKAGNEGAVLAKVDSIASNSGTDTPNNPNEPNTPNNPANPSDPNTPNNPNGPETPGVSDDNHNHGSNNPGNNPSPVTPGQNFGQDGNLGQNWGQNAGQNGADDSYYGEWASNGGYDAATYDSVHTAGTDPTASLEYEYFYGPYGAEQVALNDDVDAADGAEGSKENETGNTKKDSNSNGSSSNSSSGSNVSGNNRATKNSDEQASQDKGMEPKEILKIVLGSVVIIALIAIAWIYFRNRDNN